MNLGRINCVCISYQHHALVKFSFPLVVMPLSVRKGIIHVVTNDGHNHNFIVRYIYIYSMPISLRCESDTRLQLTTIHLWQNGMFTQNYYDVDQNNLSSNIMSRKYSSLKQSLCLAEFISQFESICFCISELFILGKQHYSYTARYCICAEW